jgi:hypothetical protein
MKKLLLLLFSILFSLTSNGEWKSFGETPYGTWYVQLDSIEESDGYVYYEILRDFPKVDKYGFLSNKVLGKADCESNKVNGISGFMSKTHMGNGPGENIYIPDEWTSPDEDSEPGKILKWVCEFVSSSNNKSSKIINIDGKNITFPAIPSLVFMSPDMLEFFNELQQTSDEMSFAYITPKDLEIWNDGEEEPTFSEFIQIRTRPNSGKDVPYSQFQEEVNSNKKELNEVEKTLNETNAALVIQDEYISSLAEVEMSNVVDAFIPFPAFIDNKNTFAATLLAAKKKTINGEITKTGRIITTLVIFINNRILNVSFYLNLSEGSDIVSQEGKVNDWLEDFWKANESSKQIDNSQDVSPEALKAFEEENYIEAIRLFKPQAQTGNPSAQFYLGAIYDIEDFKLHDFSEAKKWWEKAAKQGHTRAQYKLGRLYEFGEGTLQSYKDAFYWYSKSADAGDSAALNNLSLLYEKGNGVLKNPKKAFELLQKAVKEDDSTYAQFNLGIYYIDGTGVEKSLKSAAYWIKKAYEDPSADDTIKDAAEKAWNKNELWKYE